MMTSNQAMTTDYIESVIKSELIRINASSDPFLQHGLMGVCVFLFWYSRYSQKQKFYDLAVRLLERNLKTLSLNHYLEFNNGITGICLALQYLNDNEYLSENITDLFIEIDDHIYKESVKGLSVDVSGHENTYLDIAIYLLSRINRKSFSRTNEAIFIGLTKNILNHLYMAQNFEFWVEPIPSSSKYNLFKFLFALYKSYNMADYRCRAYNILLEIEPAILSIVPYDSINRLLYYGILNKIISQYKLGPRWTEHLNVVKQTIDVSKTISELKSNNMSASRGLIKMYLIFKYLINDSKDFEVDKDLIINKLKMSDLFLLNPNDISKNRNYWGLDGILGFIMLYLTIKNE